MELSNQDNFEGAKKLMSGEARQVFQSGSQVHKTLGEVNESIV